MIAVNNLIRSVKRACIDSDINTFNILTMCQNNEKYIHLLAQTQHNFYTLVEEPWNNLIENKPPNIQSLDLLFDDLDYILCYNRAEQYDKAQSLSRQLHVPIILIDMCSSALIRPQHLLEGLQVKNLALLNKQPALRVCSSEYIQQSWNATNSIIIPIGIDANKFQPTKAENEILIAIDNNTIEQVGAIIAGQLGEQYQIIPTDHNNLNDIALNKSRYFINTNKTITVKTLEAMAAGAVVICLKDPDTEHFIENYKTGVLISQISDLSATIESLETDKANIRIEIAKTARHKIINEHSMEQFISKWNQAFQIAQSVFYTPEI